MSRHARWLAASKFESCPEWVDYRDLVYFYKFGMLPDLPAQTASGSGFRCTVEPGALHVSLAFVPNLPPTSRPLQPTEVALSCQLFSHAIGSAITSMAVRLHPVHVLLFENGPFTATDIWKATSKKEQEKRTAAELNTERHLGLLSSATQLTEEAVLHMEPLPTLGRTLTREESERLLLALTAPLLAVPLALQFFSAEGRVALLLHPALRSVLHKVVFQPRRFAAAGEEARLAVVPADESQLGTPYGILINELTTGPDATLRPLLALLSSAADICIGDHRSSFVTLLLFVVRLVVSTG